MCTVSIVATAGGFRCIFNRDERLTRSTAHPPVVRRLGERCAMFPIDPDGGGSWIGANDSGLVAMLLNRNDVRATSSQVRRLSRGTIVIGLLEHATLDSASAAVSRLAVELFEPFFIVLVQDRRLRAISSSDLHRAADVTLERPIMFATSSLGDELVSQPRQELFASLVLQRRDRATGQETFHKHQWTSRPEVSVLMRRKDAATVSRTTIDVDGQAVRMRYEDLGITSRTEAVSSVLRHASRSGARPC
jgi:hypothetical protein